MKKNIYLSICLRVLLLLSLLSLAPTAHAAVTNVAYWRLGENDPGAVNGGAASSTANLVVGAMTLTNSPTYTNGVATTAATIGSTLGLRFNGVNQYGTNTLFNLTNNFGLEMWVRPAVSNVTQCLAYNGDSGGNGWGIYILNGQFSGLYGSVSLFSAAAAATNVWAHLALVRNNGTNIFYVNGVPAFTNTAAPNLPAGRFALGVQAQTLTAEFFNGALDEVRVFSFAPGGFSTNDLLLNVNLVTTTANSGPGSLRDAVAAALPGATITFAPHLSGQTITMTNEIVLNKNLYITASNLAANVILSGGGATRIFYINSSPTISLDNLTLTDGNGAGAFDNGLGGAIDKFNGTLTLTHCTLSENSASNGGGVVSVSGSLTLNQCALSGNSAAGNGGAIYASGSLTLNQCTFSGNFAAGNGGAINTSGSLTLNQCTLSGNSANINGGGIYKSIPGSVPLTSTILAGNTAGSAPDIFGTISGVNNLTSGNPLLAPLGNYGGPTPTMPPLPGSPAINAGLNSVTNSYTTDQRGLPRLVGGQVDIGAVESGTLIPGFDYSVVTTTNDVLNDGVGGVSLRTAVAGVPTNSIITFTNTLSGQTITLTNGQITVAKSMTINGAPLSDGIRLDGNASTRIFEVLSGSTVILDSLTLTNGRAIGGSGGGILNAGNLTVRRCTLVGNRASNYGGGIENNGSESLVINQTTFTANQCNQDGGAALDISSGPVTVQHCTMVGNVAIHTSGVGGIGNYQSGVTVYNSIIAGNSSAGSATNIGGNPMTFTGVNLTNGTPLLAPLGNYGGPTPTMPLLPGSPAIDGATNGTVFVTDQRRLPRIVGAFADLGAVEGVFNQNYPLVNVTQLGSGNVQFAFTNLSGPSYRVLASTNVAAPLNTWSNLGFAVETLANSGVFQFTDLQATNYPSRFYRVTTP